MKTLTQYPGAMYYVLNHPAQRNQRRRARVFAFLRLTVPLLFILAIGLVAGCLVAILDTSFVP
jgi:hypothetical protein